jgi:hypothetical protein
MDQDDVANNGGDVADVVVTDKQLFEHAISDAKPEPAAPAAAPSPDTAAPEPTPQQEPAGQRQRDDQGRFVAGRPQAPQQQPQPQAQPQPPAQQQRQPEDHRVPLAELHKERARAQRAEAEAAQMREAWAQFQRMQQQQAPQPQAAAPPTTIFDNPDHYLAENVVNPLRQEGQRYMMQIKDGLSREMANQQFGREAVDAALRDLGGFRDTPQGDFVFWQIMGSGHPYGALIQWHKQARAQQAIGHDPEAWLRKQQEAWFNDPNVQAKMIEHVRKQQQQKVPGRPPNVQLPPSLSSLPAAASRIEDQGDLTDASLYRFATR